MPWRFTPETYDGVDINDASYESKFLHEHQPLKLLTRDPVEVGIPGDYSFPSSPRSQAQSGTMILTVRVKTDTQAGLDAARRLFDRFKGSVDLTISDNGGNTWTASVKCTQFVERTDARSHFVAMLYTNKPVLESATRVPALHTVTASPSVWDPSLTVGGVVRTYPTLAIKPTVAKTNGQDYLRRWNVHMPWRSELAGEDSMGNGYPVDVANGALNTAAEVAAGRMLASGDDLRVIVNGVEYGRALSGMNGANTKVWVPIHFSPGRTARSIIPTSGATEIDVTNSEGLLGWPERGEFMVDNERIWYGARTNTRFLSCVRGYRGTTATLHIDKRLDWVEHDIQMVSDFTAAQPPVVPTFAIDLAASTNLAHVYSSTIWSPTAQRYGQLAGRFTQDNFKSPVLSMIDTGAGGVTIKDTPPGGTGHPYNNLELYVPCGVKVAASAISLICDGGSTTPAGADIVLNGRVYGVGIDTGVEALLATYAKAARSASATTLTPTAVLQRLRFNAVYKAITGAWTGSQTASDNNLGAGGLGGASELAQRFTLDQRSVISAIALWARENAGADAKTIDFAVSDPDGDPPEPGKYHGSASIANAQLATTYSWVYGVPAGGLEPIAAPAGQFDVIAAASVAGAGTLYWGRFSPSIYAAGQPWTEVASVWTAFTDVDRGFLILGDGSIVQPEAPSGMLGYVLFDEITVTFDNTNLRTPGYLRGTQETISILRPTISHEAGSAFDLFYIAKINETITVDTDRKLVILDEANGIFAPHALTPLDPEQWLYLNGNNSATGNTLTYTNVSPGTVEVQVTWKDRWA